MTLFGSASPAGDPPGATDVITATVDEQGIVTGWSEGATRRFGHRGEDIVGRPLDALLADDAKALMERTAGVQTWKGEVTARHRDGRPVTGALLVHRRRMATGTDRLLVWGVTDAPPAPRDRLPVDWCFEQAPCIMAVFDTDLRYVHVNADEERAIGLSETQLRGLRITQAVPDPESARIESAMRRAMETGERQYLEVHLQVAGARGAHAWAIHLAPLTDPAGRLRGVCFAAQDTTERYEARQRLLLLNEAGTRIGTSLDVAHTARQLVELAVPRLADAAVVDLLPVLDNATEPPDAPLADPVALQRVARRPDLQDTAGAEAAPCDTSLPVEWLTVREPTVYGTGAPALARWARLDPQADRFVEAGAHEVMTVPLRVRGTTLGTALFIRHRPSAPFAREDLLLAGELTARAATSIENARYYARERAIAVTLQHSLMPRRLADQTAVQVASHYLPASTRAGVGGDWFDVIPLSGARVALVIGDVVGHGIQASATMGRLRTAVRTLADIDLPPDELLTHLDDLIVRLAADEHGDSPHVQGEIGATCLYAVYDPITRACALASAGHLPPALLRPHGTVEFLDLPAGPPLGLGGLPFETTELELPEGSLLALYTNGLVERRGRDFGKGLETLRHALAQPADSLQAVCDATVHAVRPARQDDDAALLLARTRTLSSDHVVTWDVPPDPTAVAPARRDVRDRLAAWDLEELSFVTELIASELVTNAIRYGQPPVRLRLIRDRSLICEVSDNSVTAPRLKRARTFDEGGRGLLLVAQLTQRWGTRYAQGKTIWAELDLPGGAPAA
ncbi:SpoIIE family protein phosphatase [Streptomyces hydrogenans]|uniref:SpoIIE family protein phosphatase n=1 Tax=Streptomyces hydrogenans TaxID=1873719 RepID=UPI00278C5CBD|nr:SpoIIE family protein phosphatase [Streptomyces hydrogenans]